MRTFRNYIVLSLLFFQLFAFGQGNIHEEVLLGNEQKSIFDWGEYIFSGVCYQF